MNRVEAGLLTDFAFAVRDVMVAADPADEFGTLVPCVIGGVQRLAELLLGLDAEAAYNVAYDVASLVLLDDN